MSSPAVILVVDDNAENRALAEATLTDDGYRVVLAAGGEAAIAAFVRERPEVSERSRKAATQIRDEGRALSRMISTLLDIAKADEGQLAPTRQRIEIHALANAVMAELEVRATAAGVRLAGDVGALVLHADLDLIRRVLENLVENAIRYAPGGSEIRVTACLASGGVELRIHDTGPGVPVEQRERVFERFVQAGAETTRTNRGLGLAFCKLAVEAHGGRIWIEDGSPGVAFCLWIQHVD